MTLTTTARSCLVCFLALTLSGCVERIIYEREAGQSSSGGSSSGDLECAAGLQCGVGEVCFEDVCVGTGSVRFSLSWEESTDLDIHVGTPSGSHIHFAVPFTEYARLDVDDCIDSVCFDPDGTHVENVFLEDHAPRGRYVVWVENFDGQRAADYRIDVVGEVNVQLAGSVSASEGSVGPQHEVQWN